MSGSRYGYVEGNIQVFAEDMALTTVLRRVFKKHLLKVYTACKAIALVDSSDSGPGDEVPYIQQCLGPACTQAEFVESCNALRETLASVQTALNATLPYAAAPPKPKRKSQRAKSDANVRTFAVAITALKRGDLMGNLTTRLTQVSADTPERAVELAKADMLKHNPDHQLLYVTNLEIT